MNFNFDRFYIFISRVFSRLNFTKVLIIFAVGLISRVIVNYVYDINVFKDYTNVISLTYYGGFAWFVGFVNGIPKISLDALKLSNIRNAFSNIIYGNNKITMGYPVSNNFDKSF